MELEDLEQDPVVLFQQWHRLALNSDEADPDAMAMATANAEGRPSVRMVLYKGISQGGFMIFTSYESRKAIELAENPYVALVVYWPRCYRQVRIDGKVEKVSPEESEQYFHTRGRESQVSAWASEQSFEIPDRQHLVDRFEHYQNEFENEMIPCPPTWGGYRLIPHEVEFWEGREHRLHDRFRYKRDGDQWSRARLAP